MRDRDDTWANCPAGTVAELAGTIRRRETRRRRNRLAALGAFVVLLAAGVSGFQASRSEPVGALTCSDVRHHMHAILNNTLDGPLGERIRAHLASCIDCRKAVNAQRQDSVLDFSGSQTTASL